MGTEVLFIATLSTINTCRFESLKLTKDGFVSLKKVEGLKSMQTRAINAAQRKLKIVAIILSDEVFTRMVEEEGFANDILQVLVGLQSEKSAFIDVTIEVHSRAIYDEILEAATSANLVGNYGMESKVMINAKYKTVAKKVKPMAIQLPPNTNDHVQHVGKEPRVREARKIGHKFTEERMTKLRIERGEFLNKQERKMFQNMLFKYDKAFASAPDEIGCVQPSIVAQSL